MRQFLLVLACLAATLPSSSGEDRIRLVIRGDDFGYSHASNLAMTEAFDRGVMTSASVLVPGPWFAETAAMLAGYPGRCAGVHLTITSEWNRLRWRPVSPISEVPTLVAPDGYLWAFGYSRPRPADWPADGAPWAEHDPAPAEVEKELRAQVARANAMGVKIGYVDCHMGMACREQYYPFTRKIAQENCLTISGGPDFGAQRMRVEFDGLTAPEIKRSVIAALRALTPGLWLYVGHPAKDSSELRAVDSNSGERWAPIRDGELQAWVDPEVRRVIEERGIELVSMCDLFDYSACGAR